MRIGSLFAGIGGFDLAAHQAGHEVVWSSEKDRFASQTLAKNFPDIPNLGDIHGIRPDDDLRVDCLVGGFPCQDYSVAGRGAGLAGDRGALWWEYLRLISGLRPTWVLGENVPGLISSRGGEDFETIIASLTECGYGVAWAVLDAQYFGVAQRRRRVFIVGHSGGIPRPEVLALAEGMFGHPEPSRETGSEHVSSLTSRIGGTGADDGYAQAGWLIAFNSSQDPIEDEVAGPLDQNSRASTAVAFATNQRDEIRDLNDRMKQQTFVTKPSVRRLTPLECERLQGFPDGWTEGVSDTQRYRQLGNAVAVPVARWIFERFNV